MLRSRSRDSVLGRKLMFIMNVYGNESNNDKDNNNDHKNSDANRLINR